MLDIKIVVQKLYTKGGMGMNTISIDDSRNLLQFTCEDLKALKI